MKHLAKILKNKSGQSIMEYVIISSLIGIFCLSAMSSFGKTIKTRIDAMKSKVVETITL